MNTLITVLYASMSGNSMDCARNIAGRLACEEHTVVAVDLAHYLASDILREQVVLVCISTWGEGDPPDDAVEFLDFLRSLAPGDLCKLRFSVFALGDVSYEHFCQCGKDVDALFEKLGGRRIAPRLDGDLDYDKEFARWSDSVSEALAVNRAIEQSPVPLET